MTENLSIDPARLHLVEENYKRIQEEINQAAAKSGRPPEAVQFMAVTKTVEPAYINQAIACGIHLIGENRVQEFLGKRDQLHLAHCQKHLIGHLQTNKVRQIVGQVDMIQSVGSLHLAEEIGKQSLKAGLVTPVLLEINIGGEESKSGFSLEELHLNLTKISKIEGMKVEGLMTIPPVCDNPEEARPFFSKMNETFIDIRGKNIDNISMGILSMGMSGDFAAAIEEGANLVRVGSALFGARIYQ